MATDEIDVFAQFARDFCTVMLEAEQMPLDQRVFGIYRALSGVLVAGTTLPVVPGRPGRSRTLENFPGLGSYEPYWTVGALKEPGSPLPLQMTATLTFVFQGLWAGLEKFDGGERTAAAGTWGLGFERSWGVAASELVHALHPVVAAYRGDLRAEEGKQRPVMPALAQPAEDSGPGPDPEVGLGVQFAPCPGGLEVTDVHRQGLGAGKLQAGDLVIGVNGKSLEDLDPDELSGLPLKFEIFRDGETLYVEIG